MKLLLVVAAACTVLPHSMLAIGSKHSRNFNQALDHQVIEVNSPDGSLEPFSYNLFTNDRSEQDLSSTFDKGSVQAFPHANHHWHYTGNVRTEDDKKLVCYFGSWSVYRSEPYDFAVTDIDPFSCTHIIYSFAGLDNTTWTIKVLDPELDIEKGAYKAAIGLKAKNPKLKVMIAIGGWAEGGKSYSDMVSEKERRDIFVSSVVSFMEEHQWDGLDLDWEYPGSKDRDGRPSDKANFAALVRELSAEFKPRGWLLTAAVTPARSRVDEGYDVARIARDLDFIFVMTYDLRGIWYGFADHHAPLSQREIDSEELKYLNTIDGLNYWHSKGAPMHKLLMGIPFYSRAFTLASINETMPGSLAKSGSPNLDYYLLCQSLKEGGWEVKRDSAGGPYMVKGDTWLGYDDTEYIAKKMEVVHSMGLGGAFMWSVDSDDWLGRCGPKWPLLTTMRKGLYGTAGPTTEVTPVTKPTGCHSNSDCPSDHTCFYGICVDPCAIRCGPNANCQVYDYIAYCTCPLGFTGNPYVYCTQIGCSSHNDCRSDHACVYGQCVDPCYNRCGQNANCQVYNYQAYCTCPNDHTGNPYLYCSKLDIATTAATTAVTTAVGLLNAQSCSSQNDCRSDHACVLGQCVDPCYSRCGRNANCQVYNYQGYCTCPNDHTGNPYLYCSKLDLTSTTATVDGITEASTDESPTEISEPLPGSSVPDNTEAIVCKGPGYLWRDESSCSVYYLCDDDLDTHKFVCPEGLYFDLTMSRCDWPENVKC